MAATQVQPASSAAGAAPSPLPLVYAAQFAQQSAALREDGYNVRNTFIDSPVVWWESCSAAPRSYSSPPVAGRVPDRSFKMGEKYEDSHDDPGSSEESGSYATAPAGARRPPSGNSKDSSDSARRPPSRGPSRKPSSYKTAGDRAESSQSRSPNAKATGGTAASCSSGSRSSSVNVPSDSTPSRSDDQSTACSDSGEAAQEQRRRSNMAAELAPEERDALQNIADLVESQCAFLRLNGHTLHVEHATRMRSRGIVATLRFYAYGLPWPKRAKWVQPLCRSAAAILRCHGCDAKLLGGELQVMLTCESFVRVDFSAARL